MTEAQAIFFPASGFRLGNSGTMLNVGNLGYYWPSTPQSGTIVYFLSFTSGNVNPSNLNTRAHGYPIRCVRE